MIKVLMRTLCVAMFMLSTFCSSAQILPNVHLIDTSSAFNEVKGPVNDYEKLFTKNERMTLLNVLTDFEESTGIRIAIITLDTNLVAKANFNEHLLLLANDWNVRNENKKPGILVGISQSHRLIRINNSYAIQELISDAETAAIMNEFFIKNFKTNHYYRGTIEGVQELMKLLRIRVKEKS